MSKRLTIYKGQIRLHSIPRWWQDLNMGEDAFREMLYKDYGVIEYVNHHYTKAKTRTISVEYRHTYIEFPTMEAKTMFVLKWVN